MSYRKNARKHTIVVTDGQCTHTYLRQLDANAAGLRAGGKRQVWGIGVGHADMAELRMITDDYRVNRTLHIEDYDKIEEIKQVVIFLLLRLFCC